MLRIPRPTSCASARVNAGGAALQIVCGAANARAGLKVPLAQVGAKLPGDLNIKAAKLRGVESAGMLCSAKELGLAATSSGLLELPADAPVGTSIREYLKLDDSVLELKMYANRGDSMSVLGVAREIAALAGTTVKAPAVQDFKASATAAAAAVVQATAAAPRFLTRRITGLDNKAASPLWLQERLRRAGLRSINPVVDVTNHVLLELGQPMHAYDAQRLKGALTVRMARAGEELQLLDERSIELTPDVLLIADDSGPIGMAGVMGGLGTAITADATDVLLEVAFFAPDAIAGRGRRHGIQTDASQRFERGVDPSGQALAMQRATALLLLLCGGEASAVAEVAQAAALPTPRAGAAASPAARAAHRCRHPRRPRAAEPHAAGHAGGPASAGLDGYSTLMALRHRHRSRSGRGSAAHRRLRRRAGIAQAPAAALCASQRGRHRRARTARCADFARLSRSHQLRLRGSCAAVAIVPRTAVIAPEQSHRGRSRGDARVAVAGDC